MKYLIVAFTLFLFGCDNRVERCVSLCKTQGLTTESYKAGKCACGKPMENCK